MGGEPAKLGLTYEMRVMAYLLTQEYGKGGEKLDLRDPFWFDPNPAEIGEELSRIGKSISYDLQIQKGSAEYLIECKSSKSPVILSPTSNEFSKALLSSWALEKYREFQRKRNIRVTFVVVTNMSIKKVTKLKETWSAETQTLDRIRKRMIKRMRELGSELEETEISPESIAQTLVQTIFLQVTETDFIRLENDPSFKKNLNKVIQRIESKDVPSSPIVDLVPQEQMPLLIVQSTNDSDDVIDGLGTTDKICLTSRAKELLTSLCKKAEENVMIEETFSQAGLKLQLPTGSETPSLGRELSRKINGIVFPFRAFVFTELKSFLLYNPVTVVSIVSMARDTSKDIFDLGIIKKALNTELTDETLIQVCRDSYKTVKRHDIAKEKFC